MILLPEPGLSVSSLSVILPALNEAENLRRGVEPAIAALSSLGVEWELIIVDDGSTDATWSIASRLACR